MFKMKMLVAGFALFLLLQCRSPQLLTTKQEIDRLRPDNKIEQAEYFYREGNRKWTLYAWNQTSLENLTEDQNRETYRILKNWLFSEKLEGSAGESFKDTQVSALYLDYDDLWMGTWNGGVSRISLSSKNVMVLEPDRPTLVPKVVYRVRKSGNAFWFAMHHGLRFFNYQTGISGYFPMIAVTQGISDFLENSEGLFVSSLSQGVWQRTRNGNFVQIGKGRIKPAVSALSYQDDIGLVIGTVREGAFRWKNNKIEPLEDLEPVFEGLDHVHQIVNDGSSLWFASSGEGLFRWNYKGREAYQILAETFLLRSNRISAIAHSGDWVFVGDDKGGIAGYHLGDQLWYMWDGGRNLEFSTITSLAYRSGELFYSTLAGGVYQIHWLKYLFALREKRDIR